MSRRGPQPAALALVSLFFLVYYAVFGAAAWMGESLPKHRLYFAWECHIPLLPWTSLIYMSINVMIVPVLQTFPTVRQLVPLLATIAVELTLATLTFLLLPLEAGFPENPVAPGGMGGALLSLAQAMALRHNYLPSLHVALAFTGAATLSREKPSMSAPLYLWASLIALSTLTTHEHHLADILAGMALAAGTYRWVYLPLSRRQPQAQPAGGSVTINSEETLASHPKSAR